MASLRKIDSEGDQRESLLLSFAEKLVDLLSMKEQFAGPDRIMVHNVAVTIGTDVAMMEKHLALFDARITVL